MTNPSHTLMICFVFLVLLNSPTPTMATVIEDFCKHTTIYNDCTSILQSDPKASSAASLHDLGGAIIELAIKDVFDTQTLIKGIDKRGLPPPVLGALSTCNDRYGNVPTLLKNALDDFGVRVFDLAIIELVNARDDVNVCKMALSGSNVDKVSKQNDVVFHLCDLGRIAMIGLRN